MMMLIMRDLMAPHGKSIITEISFFLVESRREKATQEETLGINVGLHWVGWILDKRSETLVKENDEAANDSSLLGFSSTPAQEFHLSVS